MLSCTTQGSNENFILNTKTMSTVLLKPANVIPTELKQLQTFQKHNEQYACKMQPDMYAPQIKPHYTCISRPQQNTAVLNSVEPNQFDATATISAASPGVMEEKQIQMLDPEDPIVSLISENREKPPKLPEQSPDVFKQLKADQIQQLNFTARTLERQSSQFVQKSISVSNLKNCLSFAQNIQQTLSPITCDFSSLQLTLILNEQLDINHIEDDRLQIKPQALLHQIKPEISLPLEYICKNDSFQIQSQFIVDNIYCLQLQLYFNAVRVADYNFQFKPNNQEQNCLIPTEYQITVPQKKGPEKKTDLKQEFNLSVKVDEADAEGEKWEEQVQICIPLHAFSQQLKSNNQQFNVAGKLQMSVCDRFGTPKSIKRFPMSVYQPTKCIEYDLNQIQNINLNSMSSKAQFDSYLVKYVFSYENPEPMDIVLFKFTGNNEQTGQFFKCLKQIKMNASKTIKNPYSDQFSCEIFPENINTTEYTFMFTAMNLQQRSANTSTQMHTAQLVVGEPIFRNGKLQLADESPLCLTFDKVASGYEAPGFKPAPFTLPIQIVSQTKGTDAVVERIAQRKYTTNDINQLTAHINVISQLNSYNHLENINNQVAKICSVYGEFTDDDQDLVCQLIEHKTCINSIILNFNELTKVHALRYPLLTLLQIKNRIDNKKPMEIRTKLLSQNIQSIREIKKQFNILNSIGLYEAIFEFNKALDEIQKQSYTPETNTADAFVILKKQFDFSINEYFSTLDIRLNYQQLNGQNLKLQDMAQFASISKKNLPLDDCCRIMLKNYNEFEKQVTNIINWMTNISVYAENMNIVADLMMQVDIIKKSGHCNMMEILSSAMSKTAFMMRAISTILVVSKKPEVLQLMSKFYPDIPQITFKQGLADDLCQLTILYIKLITKVQGTSEALSQPLIDILQVLQMNECDKTTELLKMLLIYLKSLSVLKSDLLVQSIFENVYLYVEKDYQLMGLICDILLRNQQLGVISELSQNIVNSFVLQLPTQFKKTNIQIFSQIINLDFQKINVDLYGIVSTIYLIFNNQMKEYYNVSVEILFLKLKSMPIIDNEQDKRILFQLVVSIINQLFSQSNDENVKLKTSVKNVLKIYATDGILHYLLDSVFKYMDNDELLQQYLDLFDNTLGGSTKFTKHSAQQVLYILQKYLQVDSKYTSSIIQNLLKRINERKTDYSNSLSALVKTYTNFYFQITEHLPFIQQLTCTLDKSELGSFSDAKDRSALAIEYQMVAFSAIFKLEKILLQFVDFLQKYDDARIHWVLDCLFVLYLCADSKKSIDIIQRKQQLINQGIPDIFLYLQVLINQRQIIRREETRSHPTPACVYPNYKIQNGACSYLDLYYDCDFEACEYLRPGDLTGIQEFYSLQYVALEHADVTIMRAFIQQLTFSVPSSLIQLRCGQIHQNYARQLRQTISLQKPAQINNFGLSIQYFTDGRMLSECSASLQRYSYSITQKIQGIPSLTSFDLTNSSFGSSLSLVNMLLQGIILHLSDYASCDLFLMRLHALFEVESGSQMFYNLAPLFIPKLNFVQGRFQEFYPVQRKFWLTKGVVFQTDRADFDLSKANKLAEKVLDCIGAEVIELVNNCSVNQRIIIGGDTVFAEMSAVESKHSVEDLILIQYGKLKELLKKMPVNNAKQEKLRNSLAVQMKSIFEGVNAKTDAEKMKGVELDAFKKDCTTAVEFCTKSGLKVESWI
ncbi:Conserved_hypothetical protein [Hexamita inflata]|uniref:Uncharacterized protein n=1 Tax=Hexamita inflata TaxID=28002 RepID=A0AA86PGE8_9EUKA|nr:Conserved hypothetical protein [Hexamita inflata]